MIAISVPGTGLLNPIWFAGDHPIIIPLLLALEGVLITVFARKSSVYFFRFVPFWMGVSALTFVLAIIIMGMIGATEPFLSLIVAEAVVILLEALCISFTLSKPIFAKNPGAAPSYGKALAISLIINLVSFFGYL